MNIYLCKHHRSLGDYLYSFLNRFIPSIKIEDCPIPSYPDLALKFAQIRVINPDREGTNSEPLRPEINFEMRKITECYCGKGGVYSGNHYALILRKHIPGQFADLRSMPVLNTPEYLATFQFPEMRWHLRYGIFSIPTLISINGIIEAPARPRGYYLKKVMGLDGGHNGRYLTHSDKRLSRILAGILLQGLFYYRSGNPFCSDRNCSLYNSHWQEDLIRSQRDDPHILCPHHTQMLTDINSGGIIRHA